MATKSPLAGIHVPSIDKIVEDAMAWIPKSHIDMGHPMIRERFRKSLEIGIERALFEVQHSTAAATEKAVEHVFRLMKDEAYQGKKEAAQKRRAEARLKRKDEEPEPVKPARLIAAAVPKATVQ